MNGFNSGRLWGALLVAWLVAGLPQASEAQTEPAELTEGFEVTLEVPRATTEELSSQTHLWTMEVSFKPLRMIYVELPDPETGETRPEPVWYLVYRAVNRPIERPEISIDRDRTPVNDLDPLPDPLFVPECTLVSDHNGQQTAYADIVLPEAHKEIVRRERRKLKNSVQIVGPVPPPISQEAEEDQVLYGVVMWRNVDPRADHLTVFLSGFSNGFQRVKGPDGEPLIARKTIRLDYRRPGDEFELREREYRRRESPEWIYRPDELQDETPAETAAIAPAP